MKKCNVKLKRFFTNCINNAFLLYKSHFLRNDTIYMLDQWSDQYFHFTQSYCYWSFEQESCQNVFRYKWSPDWKIRQWCPQYFFQNHFLHLPVNSFGRVFPGNKVFLFLVNLAFTALRIIK